MVLLKRMVRIQMGYHCNLYQMANLVLEVVVAHPLVIPSNVLVHVNPLAER